MRAHDDPLVLLYPDPAIRRQVRETVTSKPEKAFREWTAKKNDGSEAVCLWANFKLPDGLVINLGYDITERKLAEAALLVKAETERLLRRELDHRVRNNLASLISLIDLSCSRAADPRTFAESITGRVQTIARVHSVLSQEEWRAIDLKALLQTLMATSFEGQLKLEGPAVIVPPGQAQAIGLVAHELETNSRKYGALSNPEGRVNVTWETQEREHDTVDLQIRWIERGGPTIDDEPTPGVGMNLIRGLVTTDLRGHVDFRFPAQGANHLITISLVENRISQAEIVTELIRRRP